MVSLTWALLTASLCITTIAKPAAITSLLAKRSSSVTVLKEFTPGSWCENLAIRPSGEILVTRLDTPMVLQVDPTGNSEPITVAKWDPTEYSGALGISETDKDVFNVVLGAFINDEFKKVSGVNSIFKVDMKTFNESPDSATVTKVVDIADSDFINGMTTLDSKNILVTDAYRGKVLKVDTEKGTASVAVDDPKMKFDIVPNPQINIGANGIKIKDSYLYWTNTAAGTLNKIKIESSGKPKGRSSVVTSNVPKADDFVIKGDSAYLCLNQVNQLSRLSPLSSSKAEVIAGSETSTELAGVSSGQFGRSSGDSNRLYLTTSGGLANPINGSITVPGTVSYIDI